MATDTPTTSMATSSPPCNRPKIEYELGIQTTYYLLHPAPYHGQFQGDVFHRNEESAELYRKIQDFGHEIALHTDALTLFPRPR